MAFANPLSITIGGTAHSLKRINQDNYGSVYQKLGDGLEIICNVRHTYENRKPDGSQMVRHNVEIVYTTYSETGIADSTIAYVVVRSKRGKDPVVATNVLDALGVLVDAQSSSIVDWET